MNNIKLRHKFMVLYIFCILIPVVLVELGFVTFVRLKGGKERVRDLEYGLERVEENIFKMVDNTIRLSNLVCNNEAMQLFMDYPFASEEEYIAAYNRYKKVDGLRYLCQMNETLDATIYLDNETIKEDKYFQNINRIQDTPWYQELVHSGRNMILYVSQESKEQGNTKVSIIRKLFEDDPNIQKILKIDLDSNRIQKMLEKEPRNKGIYVYEGEELLFSRNRVNKSNDFESKQQIYEKMEVEQKEITLLNHQWTIIVTMNKNTVSKIIYQYRYGIFCLLLFTLIFPTIMIRYVSKSVLSRIALLENSFDMLEENMVPISMECGKDELGMLVKHFNVMVNKINELIHRNHRESERLRVLELSKKQAELNALLSQVNPHFMYNTLECISMRALLKDEKETANIILKLSLLFREMSSWRKDEIPIKDELKFVEAYLEIQKYRFGDKISFEIVMEPECEENVIPKLTIVSFVENACVHGIEEALEPGKVIVKVISLEQGWYVSVKDTGCGMSKENYEELVKRITNSDITSLYQSDNTGVLNSYIRLKMYFKEHLEFSIKSSEEQGTLIELKIREQEEKECTGYYL